MRELIERIKLVLSPYRNFNHHIAVVDELIELVDEKRYVWTEMKIFYQK